MSDGEYVVGESPLPPGAYYDELRNARQRVCDAREQMYREIRRIKEDAERRIESAESTKLAALSEAYGLRMRCAQMEARIGEVAKFLTSAGFRRRGDSDFFVLDGVRSMMSELQSERLRTQAVRDNYRKRYDKLLAMLSNIKSQFTLAASQIREEMGDDGESGGG